MYQKLILIFDGVFSAEYVIYSNLFSKKCAIFEVSLDHRLINVQLCNYTLTELFTYFSSFINHSTTQREEKI